MINTAILHFHSLLKTVNLYCTVNAEYILRICAHDSNINKIAFDL